MVKKDTSEHLKTFKKNLNNFIQELHEYNILKTNFPMSKKILVFTCEE